MTKQEECKLNDETTILIRYAELDFEQALKDEFLHDHQTINDAKYKMLQNLFDLDIDRNLTPVQNWYKYLCDINGMEFKLPIPRELAEAILFANASRFMFILT